MSKKKLLSRSMAAVAAVAVLGTAIPANAAELDWGADKNGIITLNGGTVGVTIDQDKTTPDKSTEYKKAEAFSGNITPENMKKLVLALSVGQSVADGTYDAKALNLAAGTNLSDTEVKNATAASISKIVDGILNGTQQTDDLSKKLDAAAAALPADFGKGTTIMVASPNDATYQRIVSVKEGNIPSLKDLAAVTSPGTDGKIQLSSSITSDGKEVKEGTTITDIVSYKGLTPGKKYTMHGEVIEVGGEKTGVNVGQTEFTPTEENGTVNVDIKINQKYDKGMVILETLKDDQGNVVAEHKGKPLDPHSDMKKDVTIRTSASSNTGDFIQTGTVINDTVSYTGLMPGKQYELRARLMCKDTGADTGASATHVFTPDKADGSTTVKDITVKDADCNTQVVFEQLYDDTGSVVASHEDLQDNAQTVGSAEMMKKKKKKPAPSSSAPAPAPQKPRQVINDVPSGELSAVGSTIFNR